MPCELLPLPLHFYADMSAVCVAKLSLWTAVISSNENYVHISKLIIPYYKD